MFSLGGIRYVWSLVVGCWSSGVASLRSGAKGVTLYHRDLTSLRASCDPNCHSRTWNFEVYYLFLCFSHFFIEWRPSCMYQSKSLSPIFLKLDYTLHDMLPLTFLLPIIKLRRVCGPQAIPLYPVFSFHIANYISI